MIPSRLGQGACAVLGMTGRAALILTDEKVFEMPLAERLA